MNNFDIFDQVVGRIFADLCEAFPAGREFNVEEMAKELEGSGIHDPMDMVNSSFCFLKREGFIIFDEKSPYGYISDASLRLKGLSALKRKPRSLSGESIAMEMIDAVKAGAKDKIKQLVSDAMSFQSLSLIIDAFK